MGLNQDPTTPPIGSSQNNLPNLTTKPLQIKSHGKLTPINKKSPKNRPESDPQKDGSAFQRYQDTLQQNRGLVDAYTDKGSWKNFHDSIYLMGTIFFKDPQLKTASSKRSPLQTPQQPTCCLSLQKPIHPTSLIHF